MNLYETINSLSSACGPTGFEAAAAQAAVKTMEPLMEQTYLDKMGNAVGILPCGKPNAKKILLDAHLDEVGMIVMGYDGGFLRFAQQGGIDPRVLLGREVTVMTEPAIPGIVWGPLDSESGKAVPMSKLRIDTGLSPEEVQRLIPIGTPVSYRETVRPLGEHALAGKSLDDRSCFAVLLRTVELLRQRPLDVDLYVLGSVGEETDSRGAIAAVYDIAPDYAVAVDVTFGKSPDCSGDDCFPLGAGPVLGAGPNIANWMLRRMKEKAKAENIPYGVEVMAGSTGTNGWDIQILRSGVPTAILSIPLRYMHTPVEVIDRRDVEQCARLLAAFVENIGEEAPA